MSSQDSFAFAWLRSGLQAGVPVLDLRAAEVFRVGHCLDALNIPEPELFARRQELPPPDTTLIIIADQPQQAAQALRDWQYPVQIAVAWSVELQRLLDEAGLLAQGSSLVRLWQPSTVLATHLDAIKQSLMQQQLPLRAIDLACGSGRDAVYLALNGFAVTAIDYHADALQRGVSLAGNYQLQVDWQAADIEHESFQLPSAQFSLLHVARFLYRPLLPKLAEALTPGGFLLYETFAVGAEKFGSPRNPKYLLQPGELAQMFADLDIIFDRIESLSDGRPVQRFVAQKRESS